MPTYDYTCSDCHKRFDVFMTYKEYGLKPVICQHCGSSNVRRRPPRVRIAKSDASRIEQFADPAAMAGLEDDPVALGQMMRKMGSQMGEELPAEFDEVVGRLEAGQSPDEITNAIPEFGEDAASGGGSDLSLDD